MLKEDNGKKKCWKRIKTKKMLEKDNDKNVGKG